MKIAKKMLMFFQLPFALNNEYGGILKGVSPHKMGVAMRHSQPLAAHAMGVGD